MNGTQAKKIRKYVYADLGGAHVRAANRIYYVNEKGTVYADEYRRVYRQLKKLKREKFPRKGVAYRAGAKYDGNLKKYRADLKAAADARDAREREREVSS